MSGEELKKLTDEAIPKVVARIAELEGGTGQAIKANDELAASQGRLASAVEDAMQRVATAVAPARVAVNDFITLWIRDNIELLNQWSGFWDSIVSVVSTAVESIKSVLGGLSSAVSSALSNAGSAISNAAQQGAVPGLFARGGLVSGPGTGTSDSILARLSAGEYVVNARAVQRAGLGFMQQLNGFAAGGFVGRSFPRFAEGGLVGATAGGGTPVHLHLDGQSYATHASEGVATALVSAARRQQMRSAGVKPSWYGGRPGA
jgi:hypothetical protein